MEPVLDAASVPDVDQDREPDEERAQDPDVERVPDVASVLVPDEALKRRQVQLPVRVTQSAPLGQRVQVLQRQPHR